MHETTETDKRTIVDPPESRDRPQNGVDAVRPQQDTEDCPAPLEERFQFTPFAVGGIFVLAVFYTLYFVKALILPLVIAVLLNFILSPVVRGLRRIHIPEPAGAAAVLLVLVLVGASGVSNLWRPAERWLTQAPETLRRIDQQLAGIKESVRQMTEATERAQEITEVEGAAPGRVQVEMRRPSVGDIVLDGTTTLVFGVAIAVILLYFLLASGDMFLRKIVRVLPAFSDKKAAVHLAREVEQHISTYLFTITVINSCLGAAVGLAMWLLGMPNPILWGVMAGLFNYVPYLGAMTTGIVLTLVAVGTFDEIARTAIIPIVFFSLTSLEGYFITPMVLGRTFTLNPVVIIIGMVLWGWVWGVPGMLLAVPLLVVFKIVCGHVQRLSSVNEFLGR